MPSYSTSYESDNEARVITIDEATEIEQSAVPMRDFKANMILSFLTIQTIPTDQITLVRLINKRTCKYVAAKRFFI